MAMNKLLMNTVACLTNAGNIIFAIDCAMAWPGRL